MAERPGSATADAPASPDAPRRPGLRGVLLRRWPTLLAVALAGPALLGPSTAQDVHDLAGVMMILPFWYVVVAAFDLRRWIWPCWPARSCSSRC